MIELKSRSKRTEYDNESTKCLAIETPQLTSARTELQRECSESVPADAVAVAGRIPVLLVLCTFRIDAISHLQILQTLTPLGRYSNSHSSVSLSLSPALSFLLTQLHNSATPDLHHEQHTDTCSPYRPPPTLPPSLPLRTEPKRSN